MKIETRCFTERHLRAEYTVRRLATYFQRRILSVGFDRAYLIPNVINKCIFQLRESCRQIDDLTRSNMYLLITFKMVKKARYLNQEASLNRYANTFWAVLKKEENDGCTT